MVEPVPMALLKRGPFVESVHRGHAVVCDSKGQLVQAWGDPAAVILPRSSCKMVQALPLLESGAAEAAGLTRRHLALACASHNGAAIHTDRVANWLKDLGLGDEALRCGPQMPRDPETRTALIKADASPCQRHNNCSGKHAGFLTLNRHLKAGPDYIDPEHPVQKSVRETFEEVTGETSPGYGIDGCSAPNFATTLAGLARAMGRFAGAGAGIAPGVKGVRARAMQRLVEAMTAYPELVAGEGRACTELMRAMDGRVAVKTGAEAVFVAILPDLGLGVALKIVDGATRASECAIAAILVHLGVLDPGHPATGRRLNAPELNRRGIAAARICAAPGFPA